MTVWYEEVVCKTSTYTHNYVTYVAPPKLVFCRHWHLDSNEVEGSAGRKHDAVRLEPPVACKENVCQRALVEQGFAHPH